MPYFVFTKRSTFNTSVYPNPHQTQQIIVPAHHTHQHNYITNKFTMERKKERKRKREIERKKEKVEKRKRDLLDTRWYSSSE